ncbi:mechanosensitive ion channel family protein [Allomuricauda sp. SCSIO 65647]|uniref:mechanosensitive ion channel family protein n=1 Tax=Allomuricauda sp. SCSIO 65647 TaxID=2908843 RepID=UPI001F43FC2E|nr:mechanosensitive ion channel domain-containing protein [Muricauda sp. SCSIO 65647]UJH66782.1 mechanosensitive ion channel [Muricauda sp. SCSIO 65647]
MVQNQGDGLEKVIKKDIWGSIEEFLSWGFHYGEGEKSIHITIGLLLLLITAFFATSFVLKLIRKIFTRKMEVDDKLKFISVFKFIKYVVYVAVILITMSAAGINITILITASAALFVGLGLALQELFQDIIAGLLIIIDKSLRVGDIVDVNGKVGKVFEIKLRTTRAITRDDKIIVIPNHKFISDIIYNYTQNHKMTRERVDVGVAYGSDVQLVTKLLEEVAHEQKGVLKTPKPFVLFEDFGDSALLFSIHFFVTDSFGDPKIKSAMRYGIDAKFRQNNITIPFPQRDVHFYQHMPIDITSAAKKT